MRVEMEGDRHGGREEDGEQEEAVSWRLREGSRILFKVQRQAKEGF